jgi:hypothetical protein
MEPILAEIANQVDEEYLEFEGTADSVSAFWSEWGGAEQVVRVHGWLEGLSRA